MASKCFPYSQANIDRIIGEMHSEETTEFVRQFKASRPEWGWDDETTKQTDKRQEQEPRNGSSVGQGN